MSDSAAASSDFQALVSAHYENLYRFAYSLAKNESGAADLTQQTFYVYAKKGESIRDTSKAKSWLFTTLYREFLRTRRKGSREAGFEPEAIENQKDENTTDPVRSLDAQRAVELLPELEEIYRTPLTLFYMKDMSYKDIAETLDIPIGTVMSRLSRAKSQLKALLVGEASPSKGTSG